ncbi:MAG: class I SAM-dependent methyltransferase, partial [Geminicoccaceae bacterium]
MSDSLTHDAETHFEFGKNWARYSQTITDDDIAIAEKKLSSFLGIDNLRSKTFLDIGCGSGIHALAALRLGAKAVRAVDIDQDAVATAKAVISSRWNEPNFTIEPANIFELSTDDIGQFDIVYSWGVLHHTGDMWTAIRRASEFVTPGGVFSIAIYRKTRFCGFWRWEKERYARSGKLYRGPVVATY